MTQPEVDNAKQVSQFLLYPNTGNLRILITWLKNIESCHCK